VLVSLFACRHGLAAHGGTQGVGAAATRAVVDSTLAVIIANYFLSVVALHFLGPLP
jgi:phospholipid/cholesterol/gamma-HCH transport system permease protein